MSFRSQSARPVREPGVERGELGAERVGVALVGGPSRPVGLGERPLHLGDDVAHQHRVEPHVRIERVRVVLVDGLPARLDREHVEQLHRRPVSLLRRLLDRRLEVPAEVEHEVGVEQLIDLLRGELEVVRLRAGGREVRDVHAVAAHPLGRVRERVEGGDDLLLLRGGVRDRRGHDRKRGRQPRPSATRAFARIRVVRAHNENESHSTRRRTVGELACGWATDTTTPPGTPRCRARTRRRLAVTAVVLALVTIAGIAVLWPRDDVRGEVEKLGLIKHVHEAKVVSVMQGAVPRHRGRDRTESSAPRSSSA